MRATVCNVDTLPVYLDIKDLQALLGISKTTAYELCQNELAPATTLFARKYRIKRDEVFNLLDNFTVNR